MGVSMKRTQSACLVAILLAFTTTHVALARWDECSERSCCDATYATGIDKCVQVYGPSYGPGGRYQHPGSPIALEGCVSGQRMLLAACLDDLASVRDDISRITVVHIDRGGVLSSNAPVEQPSQRYTTTLAIPVGSGGRYVLRVRNGASYPSPQPAHHRVQGSVLVNGQPVLVPAVLNASTYAIDVEVTLVEGPNTIELVLHHAGGNGPFGFVTAWLDGVS